MSCSKPGHLYKKYYCKKCKKFHDGNDPYYHEHGEFKINRYYCKHCKFTHVASLGDGKLFTNHLQYKGHEFEYFGKVCAYKTFKFSRTGVCISNKDAILINNLYKKMEKSSFFGKERKEIRYRIDKLLHKKYDIINENGSRCVNCDTWFRHPYFLNPKFCDLCKPIKVIFK